MTRQHSAKPPPELDGVLAAHERRARLIAHLHEQAMATASDLSTRQKAIKALAKDVQRRKAETCLFAGGAFVLALGCIFAVGCILALWL